MPATAQNQQNSSGANSPAPTVSDPKRPILPILILILVILGAVIFLFMNFRGGGFGEKNIAKVGSETITESEFEDRLEDQKYFYTNISNLSDEESANLEEKVREELIREILLTDLLAENGIEVTDDEAKSRIYERVVASNYGGDWQKYEQELIGRYHTTLEQVTRTERLEILQEKVAQLQTKKNFGAIWVEKNEYQFATRDKLPQGEEARLDSANAAKKQKANSAFSRVQSGEEFSKVAGDLSEDSITGENGGELGWLYLPKTITDEPQTNLDNFPGKSAILSNFDNIGLGEVKMIETFTGYVILKVIDTVEGPLENMSFDEWYSGYRDQSGVVVYD